GTATIGTLSQPAGRTLNVFTGTSSSPTYGIYNQVSSASNAVQYGMYTIVGNGNATGQKYGLYTKITGDNKAVGVYSWVPCTSSSCYAGYFRGRLLVNATTGADLDAFGVWKSIQTYSFLVKRDGRTFVNTLRLGAFVNPNDLEGTLRYTATDGFQGYRNGNWGSLGGGLWSSFGNNIAYNAGNVYVGTTPSAVSNSLNYRLLVDGKIIAEEVRVQLSGNWPDYVFDASYERLDWKALSNYIQTEKHLPGVPSAAEITEKGGIDVGEMERVLLEKVEELTLYMLELKSENESLKTRIQALENQAENDEE
ncbi:MAG: hypothetical protein AAFR59_14320, partial [Bacteroidota bacterium]